MTTFLLLQQTTEYTWESRLKEWTASHWDTVASEYIAYQETGYEHHAIKAEYHGKLWLEGVSILGSLLFEINGCGCTPISNGCSYCRLRQRAELLMEEE